MSRKAKPKHKQVSPYHIASDSQVEIPIQERLGGEALELFLRGLILQDKIRAK
ncbi:MAG: hypothetical protein WC693_06935 [Patescibacteria group bacterium]|jgi:hypothetical protein